MLQRVRDRSAAVRYSVFAAVASAATGIGSCAQHATHDSSSAAVGDGAMMTAPGAGGSGGAPSATGAGGTGGTPATGSAGTLGPAGGSGGSADAGASTQSGAGGSSAMNAADAGAANGAGGTVSLSMGDGKPYPEITLAGLVTALELAPVRLAAGGIYPAAVTIGSGGVDNLFGVSPVLVATNAETQALRASVQHPNLRIIFTVCEGLYRIVAKKSSGVATLADLRGKTIAVPRGTSSHYYLSRMLEAASLRETDVTISSQIPGMGLLSADAATIWEPGIQYVEDGLGSDAIDLQNDAQGHEVYRELFDLHATAESLSDPAKRRAIVQFVRALIDASAMLRADPTLAYAALTGPTGEAQADLEKSLHYERYPGTLVGDMLDVLEAEEAWRATLDGRAARTRAELEPLIDRGVLGEALGN